MSSHYLDVFIESLHAATIIPYASEATLLALRGFGQDITLPVLIAILGATLGQSINWAMGAALLHLSDKKQSITGKAGYVQAKQIFNKYIVCVLLLSWMPLFNIFTVAAGFLGTRYKIAFPLLLIGQAARYGWYLL